MNRLCIFGAGGHGKMAATIAELIGYKDIYFFDEQPEKCNDLPWPCVGSLSDFLTETNECDIFVAIGDCSRREEIAKQALKNNPRLVNLIHPAAIISPYSSLGNGVMVVAGAIINPFCVIEDGVIINTGATVGHDCNIHSYSHIAPGVSMAGNCEIKSKAWVGINSTLIQGITVGERTIVGAGSVVTRSIDGGLTVYGNPAVKKSQFN